MIREATAEGNPLLLVPGHRSEQLLCYAVFEMKTRFLMSTRHAISTKRSSYF